MADPAGVWGVPSSSDRGFIKDIYHIEKKERPNPKNVAIVLEKDNPQPKPNKYKRPPTKDKQRLRANPTKEEFDQIRTELQRQNRWDADLLACLIFTTGIRRNEALGLRKQDLDFDKRTAWILWQKTKGKRKGRMVRIRNSTIKNPDGTETPDPYQIYTRLKAVCQHLRAEDKIFPLSREMYRRIFNRTMVRLGIQLRTQGFHWGRHLFATEALYKGASLPVVSRALGHTRLQTTEQAYFHAVDRDTDFISEIDL